MRENLLSGKAVIPLVVALSLVGAGGAAALVMRDDGGYAPHPPSVTRFDFGPAVAPAVSFDRVALPAAELAADAVSAVDRFLAAFAAGDDARTFALLREADRSRLGSVAAWTAALTSRPAITSYTVESSTPDAAGTGAVDVTVRVSRTPQLDAFTGFVPATTVETWRATPGRGGWRVAPEPVATTAVLLPERQATADVQRWLDTGGACEAAAAPSDVAAPVVLGSDRLRALLCDDRGALAAGNPLGYGEVDGTESLLTSYGPDVASWSRFLPVRGTDTQLVVGVAPLGATWTVVAVLPADRSGAAR